MVDSLVDQFKRICAKANYKPIVQPPLPYKSLKIKLYKLIKIKDNKRQDVAWGLTSVEAEQLLAHTARQLKRATFPNDDGLPYFEISEAFSEEERHEA